MIKFKKIILGLLVLGTFATSAYGCIEKTEQAKMAEVVATVNDEKITMAQLTEEMQPIIEQFKSQYGEKFTSDTTNFSQLIAYYKTTLDTMVDNKLLLIEAKKQNLVPNKDKIDEEIQKEVDSIKKQYFNNSDEEMKKQISSMDIQWIRLRSS